MPQFDRARRSCLAVPGSSVKMLAKARTLDSDQVFLDLEDAVAPDAKPQARENIIAALLAGGWGERTKVVRVNDVTTRWAYRDVIELVTRAGAEVDCVMLPKVQQSDHVRWLDILLTQLELDVGLPLGRIGIEAQIESPRGLSAADEIAAASPRLETLVFGPADFTAAAAIPSLQVGQPDPAYPGDVFHYALFALMIAARTHGLQVIDGPYPKIHDVDGYRAAAARSAALGYDGKWVLHPAQIASANEVFSPAQAAFDRAEAVLEAYAFHTSPAGGAIGAVMLGDEMIDEASRKMALVVAGKGRRAGMQRST